MPIDVCLFGVQLLGGRCAASIEGTCCPLAQLLDVTWPPVDSDCPGIKVLWGAALEDRPNVDLILARRHDGLPVLQTHQPWLIWELVGGAQLA